MNERQEAENMKYQVQTGSFGRKCMIGNGSGGRLRKVGEWLMGAGAAACGISSVGLLTAALYMLFHFATAGTVSAPWLFAGDISGVLLLFDSTMTAVIAVALGAAAIFLIRRICAEE